MRMISILGLIALPSVFVKTVVCLTKATSPFPTARHLNWQERWSNHQGKGQCSSQKTITSLRFCYVVDSCGLQCSELWRLNLHLKSVCFFFFLFFFYDFGDLGCSPLPEGTVVSIILVLVLLTLVLSWAVSHTQPTQVGGETGLVGAWHTALREEPSHR